MDVNIHPAKREVKFHREFTVRRLVTQAVRETLLAFSTGETTESTPPVATTDLPVAPAPPTSARTQITLPHLPAPLSIAAGSEPVPRAASQPPLKMGFAPTPSGAPFASPSDAAPPAPARSVPAAETTSRSLGAIPEDTAPAASPAAPPPLLTVPLRLIGVVGRLYVLFESDRGLVLMDQHAAHERVLYEQMLERLACGDRSPSQNCCCRRRWSCPRATRRFAGTTPGAGTVGVGLSEFGERTFLLDALPPFVKVADARRFVLDLVDELKAAGREVNALRLGEQTVAKTVCRHAVKANDPLAGPELLKLVEALRRCAMPYTCPHGRPTLIEFNYRELEKKFGRLQ